MTDEETEITGRTASGRCTQSAATRGQRMPLPLCCRFGVYILVGNILLGTSPRLRVLQPKLPLILMVAIRSWLWVVIVGFAQFCIKARLLLFTMADALRSSALA